MALFLLVAVMLPTVLTGCAQDEDDKIPYRPIIWGERPGDRIVISPDALILDPGDSRQGRFEDAQFQGFLVYGGVNTVVNISLKRTSGNADAVLIVYGPRQDGEIWSRHAIMDDDSGKGPSASIKGFKLPERGEYLVVATNYSGVGVGGYSLTLSCQGGCNAVPCPVEACHDDGQCSVGFKNDARGCRSCECLDECVSSADCGPSQVCIDGQCREECTCTGGLAPVCGADGQTYANACEARCNGVTETNEGACAELCPELECGLTCDNGFVLDESGCPTCACQSPCDSCDSEPEPVCTRNGLTYTNECQARCNGERVAYAGRCNASCTELVCELECDRYSRDESGCPECACEPRVCPEVLDPVCGVNGVTYNTGCEAERAGVEIAFEDVCPRLCDDSEQCPDEVVCRDLQTNEECDGEGCVGRCVRTEGGNRCESNSDCWSGFRCVEGVCMVGECAGASCNALVFDPVCGADGETYFSPCVARCAEQAVVHIGACCEPSSLDRCGMQCENGFAVDGDGCDVCECREAPSCECQPVDNPVCGANGQTYDNACEARCNGQIHEPGPCAP